MSRLSRDSKVYVAGHRGLVGSAVWRLLQAEQFTRLVGRSSSVLDLRDRGAVASFFQQEEPDCVVLAAARVGGIMANSTYPASFLSDNLQIQVNVLDSARESDVNRLLFLGSSCIYPKFAPQPISEDSLLTGPLEPSNDAYAIAKIAGSYRFRLCDASTASHTSQQCQLIYMDRTTTSTCRTRTCCQR